VLAVPGRVEEIALAPDGKSLATAAVGEQALRLWELVSGKEHRSLAFPTRRVQHPRSLAFSADSRRVASGHWDDNVLAWDVVTGELLSHFQPKTYESGGRVTFSGRQEPGHRRRVERPHTGRRHRQGGPRGRW
jgi:WD40 repeat protein